MSMDPSQVQGTGAVPVASQVTVSGTPGVSVPTVQVLPAPGILVPQAEQTALASKDAGLAIWGLVYLVTLAALATGGYLLVSAVSQHNSQAGQWFAVGAAAVFGLFVPSPASALLKR